MIENITYPQVLNALGANQELTEQQLRWVFSEMMAGRCPDAVAAGFLMALKVKGESAREIACAARVLRELMIAWDPDQPDVLDTCGTGGDGTGTFNISTATSLVVAAAGVAVVKHGNRSVSSRTGSADVLSALGVRIDGDVEFARRCLREANFAFCFAPNFHPALKHVAGVRRALGVPTIFNCLGPLANPARASRQLIGVGRQDLLDRMAGALAELGTSRTLLICGRDGLDEVSLASETLVREIRGGVVHSMEWTASDFGLEPCTLAELAADDANASARIIRDVLDKNAGPARRIVLANAAAALLAAERVVSLRDGVTLAAQAIDSGAAAMTLHRLQSLAAAYPAN